MEIQEAWKLGNLEVWRLGGLGEALEGAVIPNAQKEPLKDGGRKERRKDERMWLPASESQQEGRTERIKARDPKQAMD